MTTQKNNVGKFAKIAFFLGGVLIAGALAGTKLTSRGTASNETNVSTETNLLPLTSTTAVNGTLLKEEQEEKLSSGRNKKITRMKLSGDRTIFLLGEMGANALDASNQLTQMCNQSSEPIHLVLSGPGGSVLTGAILISAIQACRAPVITICDVLCASMDAMVHQFGAKRYMTDRTVIMFHPASGGAQGEVDKAYSMMKFLKRYINKIELEVSRRMGLSLEAYKNKAQLELWLDAEDALRDNVSDGTVNYSADLKMQALKNEDGSEEKKKHNKTKINSPVTPFDVKWIHPKAETLWQTTRQVQ